MEMAFPRTPTTLLAAVALTSALTLGAAQARAGQYHVYSCRTPSGQPALADGWSGSVAPRGAFDQYARNTCAEGGALVAALGDVTSHGAYVDKATWAFAAPPGENIARATLSRAGDNAGGASPSFSYAFWLAGTSEASIFNQCLFVLGCPGVGNFASPLAIENRVSVPAENLGSRLYASASCTGFASAECPAGTGDANGYAAAVYIFAADITLEQAAGPSVADVAGELASASSLLGTSDVTFTASDPGAGVYEAVVSVDGQVVESPVLSENGGRCRNLGQAADGKPAFLYLQPCPSSYSADVALDTTRLTDGTHHLALSVIDAAGNAATVLDREVTVTNPAPACGASASPQATLSASWKGSKHARLITRFGSRPTILGRLTGTGGAPIAGATIDVLATPAYEGATSVQMPGAQTDANGRFSLRLPRGSSSRSLCLSYRPPAGAPPATRALQLSVRAGVALGVSPHTTGVGHQIFFNGRLLAGPVPPDGKQLVLEARSPGGGWIQFNLVRSGPRGRFHAAYRFRFPGPADYQFRAVSEPESDYPFAAGASNVVGVHER
jgi:hypothetical protein